MMGVYMYIHYTCIDMTFPCVCVLYIYMYVRGASALLHMYFFISHNYIALDTYSVTLQKVCY